MTAKRKQKLNLLGIAEVKNFRDARGRFTSLAKSRSATIQTEWQRKPVKIAFPKNVKTNADRAKFIGDEIIRLQRARPTYDNLAHDLSIIRRRLRSTELSEKTRKENIRKAEKLQTRLDELYEKVEQKRKKALKRPLTKSETKAIRRFEKQEQAALEEAGVSGIALPFKISELKTFETEERRKFLLGGEKSIHEGKYFTVRKRSYNLAKPIDFATVGELKRETSYKILGDYFKAQIAPWLKENDKKGYDGYIFTLKVRQKIFGQNVKVSGMSMPRAEFHGDSIHGVDLFMPFVFNQFSSYTGGYLESAVMENFIIDGLHVEVIEKMPS
jgi:hypothetical protein